MNAREPLASCGPPLRPGADMRLISSFHSSYQPWSAAAAEPGGAVGSARPVGLSRNGPRPSKHSQHDRESSWHAHVEPERCVVKRRKSRRPSVAGHGRCR